MEAVQELLNAREIPRRKLINVGIAQQHFRRAVLEAAAELSNEFTNHYWREVSEAGDPEDQRQLPPPTKTDTLKKGFVVYLNASGRYLVVREHLRTAVAHIVQQRCLNVRPSGFLSHRDFQSFLHDTYNYLIDEIHDALSRTALPEVDPLHPMPLPLSSVCNPNVPVSSKELEHKKLLRELLFYSEECFAQDDKDSCHRLHLQRICRSKEHPSCWTDFAIMWLGKGDDRMAEISIREALRQNISSIHALLIAGLLAIRHNDARGIDCIVAALELRPACPEILVILGLVLSLSPAGDELESDYFFRKAAHIHHYLIGKPVGDLDKVLNKLTTSIGVKDAVMNIEEAEAMHPRRVSIRKEIPHPMDDLPQNTSSHHRRRSSRASGDERVSVLIMEGRKGRVSHAPVHFTQHDAHLHHEHRQSASHRRGQQHFIPDLHNLTHKDEEEEQEQEQEHHHHHHHHHDGHEHHHGHSHHHNLLEGELPNEPHHEHHHHREHHKRQSLDLEKGPNSQGLLLGQKKSLTSEFGPTQNTPPSVVTGAVESVQQDQQLEEDEFFTRKGSLSIKGASGGSGDSSSFPIPDFDFTSDLHKMNVKDSFLPHLSPSMMIPWDVTTFSEKLQEVLATIPTENKGTATATKISGDHIIGVAPDEVIVAEYDKLISEGKQLKNRVSKTDMRPKRNSKLKAKSLSEPKIVEPPPPPPPPAPSADEYEAEMSEEVSEVVEPSPKGTITAILQGKKMVFRTCEEYRRAMLEREPMPMYTDRLGSELIWTAHLLLQLRMFDMLDGILTRELYVTEKRTIQFVYLRAMSLYLRHAYAEALSFIDEGIAMEPENPVFIMLKGHCYYELGDYPEAVRCYEATMKLPVRKENRHLMYLRYGTMALDDGNIDTAKRIFLYGLQKYPTPFLWLAVGNTCFIKEEYEQAEVSFSEANRLDNTNPIIWAHLALVNLVLNRQALAEQSYKWAIRFGLKKGKILDEIKKLQQEKGFGDPSFPRVPNCIPHEYYVRRFGRQKPFEIYRDALFHDVPNLGRTRLGNSQRENELKAKLQEGNLPPTPMTPFNSERVGSTEDPHTDLGATTDTKSHAEHSHEGRWSTKTNVTESPTEVLPSSADHPGGGSEVEKDPLKAPKKSKGAKRQSIKASMSPVSGRRSREKDGELSTKSVKSQRKINANKSTPIQPPNTPKASARRDRDYSAHD